MASSPELLASTIEAIGNTPLIDLSRITREIDGHILAELELLNPGFSSGANVAAAMELLKTKFIGKTAVVLICDSGLKYLSTDLWEN